MALEPFDIHAVPGYTPWLEAQIQQLSVTALSTQTLTCTACGEITGTYIIEYDGKKFRLSGGDTYAFLQFIVKQN